MFNDKVTILDSGSESTVTLRHSSQGPVVVKHSKPKGRTQYKFEAYAYERMIDLGASVPRVISANDNELVMSAFSGDTIDDQSHLYTNENIFSAVARDLVLCREIKFDGFGAIATPHYPFKGIYNSWNDFLADGHKKLLSSKLSKKQKDSLSEYWQKTASSINLDKGMLVHGDFALSAIFVKDDEYEGIIDFGDAIIGDPLMDIAYFRFKEITKGYGSALYELLLNHYLPLTGIERNYAENAIKLYMIYWAVTRISAEGLDSEIIDKFIDKTNVLIELLSEGKVGDIQ